MSLPPSPAVVAPFSYYALPNELLARILTLAGKREGRSIVCVCKRWERLFFKQPLLWRTFALAPASPTFPRGGASREQRDEMWAGWFEAQHRMLARAPPYVEVFVAGSPPPRRGGDVRLARYHCRRRRWLLGDFLALLRPDVLREAMLWWEVNKADVKALRRFQRLESVLLHETDLKQQAVAHMPALRSLELHANDISQQEREAILELTQLTHLALVPFCVLTATFSEPEDAQLLQLTRLQQLRELRITHRPTLYQFEAEEFYHEREGVLEIPPPSAFPFLEKYQLSLLPHDWYRWHFSVGGASFMSCQYDDDLAGYGQLKIDYVSRLDSLQQLISALLPEGMPLSALYIRHVADSVLQAADVQGCTTLAGIDSLVLAQATCGNAQLAALLQQAPQLAQLFINYCFNGQAACQPGGQASYGTAGAKWQQAARHPARPLSRRC